MQRGLQVPLGQGVVSGSGPEAEDGTASAAQGVSRHRRLAGWGAPLEGSSIALPAPPARGPVPTTPPASGRLSQKIPGMLTSTPTPALSVAPATQSPLATPLLVTSQSTLAASSAERTPKTSVMAGGELEEGEILDDDGETTTTVTSKCMLESRNNRKITGATWASAPAAFAEGYHLGPLRSPEIRTPLAAYYPSTSVREYQRRPRSRSPSSSKRPSSSTVGSSYVSSRQSHQYGRPLADKNASSSHSEFQSFTYARRMDGYRRDHYSISKGGPYCEYYGTKSSHRRSRSPSRGDVAYRENGLRKSRRSSRDSARLIEERPQEQLSFSDEEALVNLITENPDEILLRIDDLPLSPQEIASLFVKFGRQIPVALHRLCSTAKPKQLRPNIGLPSPSELPPLDPRQPIIIDDDNEVDMDIEDEDDVQVLGPESTSDLPARPWITIQPNASDVAAAQPASSSTMPSPTLANLVAEAQKPDQASPTIAPDTPHPPVAPATPSPPKTSSSLSFPRSATPRSHSSLVITLSNSDDEEDPEDHVAQFLRSCRDSVASASAAAQKEESEAAARRRKEEDQARVQLEQKEKQIQQMKARILELEKSKKRVNLAAAPASPAGSASSSKAGSNAAKLKLTPEKSASTPSSSSAASALSPKKAAGAASGSSDLDAHAALLRAQLIKRLPSSGTRSDTPPQAQSSKELGNQGSVHIGGAASNDASEIEASAATKVVDDEIQRAQSELARYKSSLADTRRLQEEQESALRAAQLRVEKLRSELSLEEVEVKKIVDEEKQRAQKKSFLEVMIRNQETRILSLTEKAQSVGSSKAVAGADVSSAGQKRRPSSPASGSPQDAKRVRADSSATAAAAAAAAERRAKDEEIADLKAAMIRVQNEQAEIRKASEERRLTDIARSSRAAHPQLEAVLAGENRVASGTMTQPSAREAVVDTAPLEWLIEAERKSSTIIELVGSEGFYQPENDIALLSTFMSKHDTGLCASEESFVLRTEGIKKEDQPATLGSEPDVADPASVLHTFQPYESPVKKLRLVSGNLEDMSTDEIISYVKTQKFDPMQRLCIFETSGGECNDDTCTSQHFRDIEVSEDDVLAAIAAEHPMQRMDGNSYLPELRNCIRKAQLEGIKTTHDLIEVIIGFRKERGLNVLEFKSASRAQGPPSRPSRRGGDDAGTSSRLTVEQISAAILRVPVTITGLVKRLDGEADYQGRYFDSAVGEDEYYNRVKREPGDPVVWINWSVSQLPEEISQESLTAPGVSLDQSIAILSKCLPHHPHCEPVWALYLELLCRRGKDEKIRDMFLKAMDLNPNCPEIYWRFYQWEPMCEAKSDILFRMIAAFSHSNRLGSREHSLLIFSVLMQLFRLAAEYPSNDPPIKLFFLLLQENATLFFEHLAGFSPELNTMFRYQLFKSLPDGVEFVAPLQVLFPDHAAMVWMAYLHWCAYFKVPDSAFHRPPYSYLAKDKYMYEVIWPQDMAIRYERYSGIGAELRRLATSGALQFAGNAAPSADEKRCEITESIRAARGVLWRNMVGFFRAAGRLAEIQNYVIKFETKNPSSPDAVVLALEVKDDVRCAEKRLKKVAARNGVAFNSLFNRSLKYLIGRVTVADLRVLLHYFIKSCFVTSDAMDTAEKSSGKQNQALVLYRYLLGLGVPEDGTQMPMIKDHVDRRKLRSNLCLWMHYLIMQVLPQSQKGQKGSANPQSAEVVAEVRRTFQQALRALQSPKDQEIMWKEWIRFEVALHGNERSASLSSDQQIVSVFAKATEDLRVSFDQTSYALALPATSNDWMSKTPVVDYSYMERVMEMALPDIPESTAGDLVDSLYRRHSKSLGVVLRAVQQELAEKRIRDARRILLEGLKRMPTQAVLWKLVGGLETLISDRDSRIPEVIAQAAVPFLPPGEIAAVKADINEVVNGVVPEPQVPANGVAVKIE